MVRSARFATAAAVIALALGWGLASADPAPPASTPPPALPAEQGSGQPTEFPTVAVVLTSGRTGRSELHFLGPDGATQAPLAELTHLPEGSVRAEVVPDSSRIVVNAPVTPGRDVAFNGGVFLLQPNAAARPLCTGVVHASRPLVTDDGRVFVSRGEAGPWPTEPDRYRVDRLTIEEIELNSGHARVIHLLQGYAAHIAGWYPPEVIVYRVWPDRADIAAVHAATGEVRLLVEQLPPFARDFSVDRHRGALVYRGRHESNSRRWVVDEIDLRTGATARRYEGASFALAPHVWPDGGVALNPRGRGLRLLGSADSVVGPLGPGVDLVRDVSDDARFVVALHTRADQLPQPFVLDRRTGSAALLRVPKGQRAAIAGFVPAGSVQP